MSRLYQGESLHGMLIGMLVGAVIGAIVGSFRYRKVQGMANEILEQIDEISKAGEGLTRVELANCKVWHQISGAAFLKNNKITDDEEILGAVRWHTTGRAGMTLLEKIVYTADFISADRKYKDVEVVRKLADISLEHAILYTSRYTIEKLVSGDKLIHPATVECYNDMLLHFGAEKG